MEELKEFLKQEIKDARVYFKDNDHFEQVFDEAGWTPESMRVFDCGYVKGFEAVLREIQNNNRIFSR